MCYSNKFKVHWEGYDSSYDTWEPEENLKNVQKLVNEFLSREGSSNLRINKRRKLEIDVPVKTADADSVSQNVGKIPKY